MLIRKVDNDIIEKLHLYNIVEREYNEEMMKELKSLDFLSQIQRKIIASRPTDSFQEVKKYIYNGISIDYRAHLLKDIDKGSDLLIKMIKENKHILIVVDYDSDGMNSGVVLYRGLKEIFNYNNIHLIVNKRMYGNGINKFLIKDIINYNNTVKQVDMMLLADHGSSDREAYEKIKKEIPDIKILLTDHHEIKKDNYPDNVDVFINHNREDDEYPYRISGCHTALNLLLYTYRMHYSKKLKVFYKLLPYVATSIITDIMPLNEIINRYIVKLGLREINKDLDPVWTVMRKILNLNTTIHPIDLGYKVGPFINTANRTNIEETTMKFLLSTNFKQLFELGKIITYNSNKRKIIQKNVIKTIEPKLLENKYKNSIVTVIESNIAISGIIAARVGETLQLPVVCFTALENSDILIGSSRAISENVDILKALTEIKNKYPDIIVEYGGHKGAAGCSINKDKLEDFKKYLDKEIETQLKNVVSDSRIVIDSYLTDNKLNPSLYSALELLAPYGAFWEEPVFATKLKVIYLRIYGNYCKVMFKTKSGKAIHGAFFINDKLSLKPHELLGLSNTNEDILVIYNVRMSNHTSTREITLNVKDIKRINNG